MLIFLDYDGTLVDITDSPEKAKIPPDRKAFIERIATLCKVSIITGRSIKSFLEVFGEIPQDLFVITSHGYEIYKGNELIWRHEECNTPNLDTFELELRKFEGVFLERKEMGFAVHYRKVSEDMVKDLLEAVEGFLKDHPPLKVIRGKKVIEALYCKVDKGTGVKKLLDLLSWKGREIYYFGDDTTDLDGIRAVKELGGKTFFVGMSKPEVADHLLASPEEVYEVLKSLCTTKR